MTSCKTARVFFALWPDAPAAARLHAIAQHWHDYLGGRVTRLDTLHSTLVFIGDISAQRLPELSQAATEVQKPGFDLEFDQAGCWRHNRIAHLGMRQMPHALQALQSDLARRLQELNFSIEKRTYTPHITLLRKADCAVDWSEIESGGAKENPATEPVGWTVRDFVLVKSSMSANGSRYEQIGRWPLL